MNTLEMEFGDIVAAEKVTVTRFRTGDKGEVETSLHLAMKTKKNRYFLFYCLGVIEPKDYSMKEFEARMDALGWKKKPMRKRKN